MTRPKAILWMKPEAMAAVFPEDERVRLHVMLDIVAVLSGPSILAVPADKLAQTEIIVSSWGVPQLKADILAQLPRLRAIFHAAGTVKPFITPEVWRRGIRVSSAALANAWPVAEFTCAQIVLCLKQVWPHVFAARERRRLGDASRAAPGLYGSTVALLGLGKIGRLVRSRLHSHEVRVIAYDPTADDATAASLGVTLVSLEEAFSCADVISCHLPLLPETTRLLRATHFAAMKPGASFINTARGEVVDETELLQVLQKRPDLTAVLDVVCDEPPSVDAPLLALPNVVFTPHIAGSGGTECRRMARQVQDDIENYLHGKPLIGEVRERELSTMA